MDGDHAPASSTTSRIIMSESSDNMELSPTKFDQVSACEKLRILSQASQLFTFHWTDVSQSPEIHSWTYCQDHKIPSTSVEEENNFAPSPPVNENKIENKININSKSKKNLAKNVNRKVKILRKNLSLSQRRRPDRSLLPSTQDPIETNNSFSDLEQDVEHPPSIETVALRSSYTQIPPLTL
ncbi:hypothetical protein TNCV_3254021 [Trichonephila clavipes]|nr:hypothetical protein TNCV_3254021 [Trichonephila clavipes]